jgi:histidyl-tRNA synthetase
MAMAKVSTKPPSGMRDFLPEDVARRRHVVGIVQEVYERYGFAPLETPTIENLDVLLGKYGEDEKLIYKLLHRGESLRKVLAEDASEPVTESALADQALRYDLTVPLARVMAQYGDLPKYFKRYQIQPVWRADRPGRGRFREFYQCDVDAMGSTSPLAEAEVCGAVAEVLARLGFTDFTLHINHRQLLRGLIRGAGIDEAAESTALVAVDKLDKIGRDGVAEELQQRGIADAAAQRLLDLITTEAATGPALLDALRAQLSSDARAVAALDELGELLRLLGATPAGPFVAISPKLARGLSYYTGPIFEISVADLAGSMGGGGRYDELIGVFGKRAIPAVGFSLGLERILVVMGERGMYPELPMGPDVLLCWRDVDRTEVLKVAHALRAGGARVEVFPESPKLGKQMQYADQIAARYAAIVGEAERDAGTVTLKHLVSGEQTTVPIADAAAVVASRG